MSHPGEQFYPEGVRWDDTITRGTLPDLLSVAAAEFGARPALEFRDRPISYTELEALVKTAASAFLRPAAARIPRSRCSSATRRIIPSISLAR